MKRNLVIAMFVAILFSTLNASSPPAALAWGGGGGGCSLTSVSGHFGFTYSGVGILPTGTVSVAAVGNYSTDATGNFVGSETSNFGGTSAFQTILGKITVNSDCSGTADVKVYQGGVLARTSLIHIQYDDNTREIRIIFQKLVLPNGSSLPVVVTGEGKRVFQGE